MKKPMKLLAVVISMMFILSAGVALWAQSGGTLTGKVIDKNEGFPLPTVRIAVIGTNKYGSADADGNFAIGNIPPGVYKVTFELSGYLIETIKDVSVQAGETTNLEVSMKMGFAHEMTVTARREIESLQKVPMNIEILTATELEETPTLNVYQALNNITGVDVETGNGLSSVGMFMSINGYDDVYIKKMVDGVDVTASITNWSLLNAYPEEMLEQVEVIKGGASSVWGSNMGGIINLVTKRPRDMAKPEFTLKGTFGHHGEQDYENASALPQAGEIIRYSGNVIGTYEKLGYMVGFKREDHELFTIDGREKNFSLFAKFGYDISDTTYLDFLYSYNKVDIFDRTFLETDWFVPYGFPYYWNYNNDVESSSQAASIKFSTLLAPALNVEAQLKFNRMNGTFAQIYLEGGFINGPTGMRDESSFMDQKLGFTVKGAYNPNTMFSLVAGMDYYRVKADFSDYILDQPIIYVDNFAPFVNMGYRIGPLAFNGGLRYDYDSSFGSQLSPSIGANLNVAKATILRANVARTFRVPPLWYTLGESYVDLILPNKELLPERAWAYSAGFESQELEFVWVKFSGYFHKMTDGIVRVGPDAAGRYTWGNAAEFDRKGYEAELGVIVPGGFSAYLATNYNKHENASEGVRLEYIPTRSWKSGLKYSNPKWDFFANLRGRWLWWNEDADSRELFEPRDKVWLVDLRLSKGFDLSESFRVALILDAYNIFDQLYWDRKEMPNPRRWIQFGFEIKFR
ncbi:MAG: carboxypeptidase regulatory-like domain-containing protein [Candidatus Aminicenantes bacterium]|nr:carboxypeptidase regulatory-like domain-containing protein [Candidatus Aminicenantes bacterium]